MKKRLIAAFLSIAMLFAFMPAMAFAQDDDYYTPKYEDATV